MKRAFLCTLCMIVSVKAYSGAWTFGPAVGVERINNRFNVDLGAIKALYRFDNGVTIGGVAMFGDISFLDIPGEARYEGIIGYTPMALSPNFSPYIFFSRGSREYYSSKSSVSYYTATVGSKYDLTTKIYLDASYRHRNTDDISWESNLYSLGVGYRLSNKYTLQVDFGNTQGDYQSDQVMFSFVTRL